ncbi:MAG: hypothetical protein AAGA23_06570 [Pseudomonadota bacterium]
MSTTVSGQNRTTAAADAGIPILNELLASSIAPITQLFLHAAVLKALGHPLAAACYQRWVACMERSNEFLETLLQLKPCRAVS